MSHKKSNTQHRSGAMSTTQDDDRTPRVQESREADVIHDEYLGSWEEQSLLSTKDIPPQDGFTQRWVRTTIHGVEDFANVQKKINAGWRPRKLTSIPKGQFVMQVKFQGADVVGVQGMILMERPVELQERHRRSVQAMTDLQLESVKRDALRVHDRKSGLTRPDIDITSKSSRGRIAAVDD